MEANENTARVTALCAEAGFPLADLRQENNVLVLQPHSLDQLPDPPTLQRLAHEIKRCGYRYVAFSVELDD